LFFASHDAFVLFVFHLLYSMFRARKCKISCLYSCM
jgi:hypothetical protein